MNFSIDHFALGYDKPILYVDYNEFIDVDLVMLSQHDSRQDFFGNTVPLREGLEIVGYSDDEDLDDNKDDLVAEGVCVRNDTGTFTHVKWLFKMNSDGVRHISDIVQSENR